jgi:hypothetical protein
MTISKFWIQNFLGALMGITLVFNGVTPNTWGFWAVAVITFVVRLVGDD